MVYAHGIRLSESALPLIGSELGSYRINKKSYADLPPDSSRRTLKFGFSERREARAQPAVPNQSADILRLDHILKKKSNIPPPTMMISYCLADSLPVVGVKSTYFFDFQMSLASLWMTSVKNGTVTTDMAVIGTSSTGHPLS